MEIVRCDGCKEDIKRNVWYYELNETSQGIVFSMTHNLEEPCRVKHFCSAECVGVWALEQAEQENHIKETLKKYGACMDNKGVI